MGQVGFVPGEWWIPISHRIHAHKQTRRLPEVFNVATRDGDQPLEFVNGLRSESYLAFFAAQLFNLACIRGPSPFKNSSTAFLVQECSSGS